MSTFAVIGSCCDVQSLCLIIRMVTVCASSLVFIRTQWMASRDMLWYVGYARPIPFHLEDFACPMEPNIISRL